MSRTHTRTRTLVSLRSFDALLWRQLILQEGGLNMGSIMMFDRSSQVDGVDSFRWAENGGVPGAGMAGASSERQDWLIFFFKNLDYFPVWQMRFKKNKKNILFY